jgi:hypothetical protein
MERVDLIVTPTTAPRLARDVAWLWQTGVKHVTVELDPTVSFSPAERELVRHEVLAIGRERLRRQMAGETVTLGTADPGWFGRVCAASDVAMRAALATPPRLPTPRWGHRGLLGLALVLCGANAMLGAYAVRQRAELDGGRGCPMLRQAREHQERAPAVIRLGPPCQRAVHPDYRPTALSVSPLEGDAPRR